MEGTGEKYKSLTTSKRRELVNKYPLFVSWYCAVRLELTLKALVVPIFGASNYVGFFLTGPPLEAWCIFITSCGSMTLRVSTSVLMILL